MLSAGKETECRDVVIVVGEGWFGLRYFRVCVGGSPGLGRGVFLVSRVRRWLVAVA